MITPPSHTSRLDRLYARFGGGTRQLFADGWGDPDHLDAEISGALFGETSIPVNITFEPAQFGDLQVEIGTFDSPIARHTMAEEATRAHICVLHPTVPAPKGARPACVHLAATGDAGFDRRLFTIAAPLARRGVTSVILENPYYGLRRPERQEGTDLRTFADMLTMCRASVEEAGSLLLWLHTRGYGPLATSGVSMGGQMAALAATRAPFPVAAAPCIGAHCGTAVFNEGLLGNTVAWDRLGHDAGSPAHAFDQVRDILGRTTISSFPRPRRPDACVVVGARRDAFIPTHSTLALHHHFEGSRLRWLDHGHVSAFVLHRRLFVRAILEALARLG